jgi:hypothetical protein
LCPQIEALEEDQLELGPNSVLNVATHKQYPIEPLPKSRQAIIDAGGLIAYTRGRLVTARLPVSKLRIEEKL